MDERTAGYDGVTLDKEVEAGLPLKRSLGCLPQDVLTRVILKLPVEDIVRLSCTCKSLRDVAMSDNDVWLPLASRFMERFTSPALWIGPGDSRESVQSHSWPSSTYRCESKERYALSKHHSAVHVMVAGVACRHLYFSLRPLMVLEGIWLGTSLHQRSPGAPPDHVFAFKWTSSALVCLRLQPHVQGVHDHPQSWAVYHVFCKASTSAPQLDAIGHGLFIMNPVRPTQVPRARACGSPSLFRRACARLWF